MNGTDLLIELGGIALIVGMLWYARWQGQDEARREARRDQVCGWHVVQACDEYTVRHQFVPDFVPADWEQAA